jgi:drug/metabolite transporter (DMT)-like permease
MPVQALPYILMLGFFFGSTVLASRFSVGQFASMTYVGLRLSLAAIAFVLLYLFSFQGRTWPRGRQLWRYSAIMSILGTVIPMNLITGSLQFQSSGVTAMLITLSPAITVVLAHFFLEDERLNGRKLVGVMLALSGAVAMLAMGETGLPDVSKANPIGYLMVFTAMLSGSFSTIFARKKMQELDSFETSSIQMWVAAMIVMPLSLLFHGFDLSGVNLEGFLALGWASLTGTFLGILVTFYVIKAYGATASSMTAYVIPMVAALGGALLLKEEITLGIAIGMVLIIGGIALINRTPRPTRVVY